MWSFWPASKLKYFATSTDRMFSLAQQCTAVTNGPAAAKEAALACVVKSVCGNSSNISHSCSGVIVLCLRDLLQNHSRAGSEIVYEYFSQYRQYHQTFCAAVQAPLLPDHQLLVREGPLRTNSAVFSTFFKRGEAGSNTCYKKLLQILYDLMINCITFL